MWIYGVMVVIYLMTHRRLIEKLMYLIVTRLDITFTVEAPSKFMHKPREVYWTTALRILAYIKGSPG